MRKFKKRSNASKDLMYLAGYLDGEGCFQLNKTPMISVGATYRPVLRWIADTFGGSVTIKGRPASNPNYKLQYKWSIHGELAIDLCNQLKELLKEKREQCELLIEYYALGQFQGRCGIPAHIKRQRDRIARKIKEAKYAQIQEEK